ncbi:DUF4097 family beta strand repeat-containing protein [Microbacterium sp. EF45047]|uniref:DUF4097 family beta strand repeat-containing protein n=1 Tax=Microbacterium sp. EF45047 TaxID=2809708 RepID=UPI00234AC2B9|nr:DUF4097 family beta strand repeat-containing protein [Microbacterium sp. EF45047]WCM55701.1 DUF4097 family beta strand repeat protein [Microbacterium sp. EF45047]
MNATGTTRAGLTTITVLTAVVGGAVLTTTGASAAVTAGFQLSSTDQTRAVDVDGVEAIDVEVGGADLTVRFGDGDQARLEVSGPDARGWSLRADGGELVVHGPDRGWNWFGPDWLRGGTTATLTLPAELAGADLGLDLQAGRIDAEGEFGVVRIDVGAGSLNLEGAATALDAEVNAGRADISLTGVREADYRVSAGRLRAELTSAPDAVTAEVSAGSLDLTVPDEEYDVRLERTAGSIDSELRSSPDARRTITATVAAGSIDLHRED